MAGGAGGVAAGEPFFNDASISGSALAPAESIPMGKISEARDERIFCVSAALLNGRGRFLPFSTDASVRDACRCEVCVCVRCHPRLERGQTKLRARTPARDATERRGDC